jgi:hypothetical protein
MDLERLKIIQGLQTLESISKKLNLTRNSAMNFISKLKRQGYATSSGGGKHIKIYKISLKTNPPFQDGMFDILSKNTPIKLSPYFTHKVIGTYKIEDAIVDLLKLEDVRPILGSAYLLNKVKDWHYLKNKARGMEAKLGALYDLTRTIRKTRKMPKDVRTALLKKRPKKIYYWLLEKKPREFEKIWNTTVPLRGGDFD